MSIHIRVVTPVVPTGLTKASDFDGILSSSDRVTFTEIENGPASVETALDVALAVPDVVSKIIEAQREGVDAVVLDCMKDPGLAAGRECVSIPVLGPCETSMNLACMLGHRFTMLAVSSNMRAQFESQARACGAGDKYASTRSVEIPVLELSDDPERLAEALFEQAKLAIEHDRADTLIIGCTGMFGVAKSLQNKLGEAGLSIPVIDPIPNTVRIAKVLVETGISHSKIAFPVPAPKEIRGYDDAAVRKFTG